MEDIARAVLTGVAIGGFTAAVVEANILAVKALCHFNHLAAETALEMCKRVVREHIERLKQRMSDEIKNES